MSERFKPTSKRTSKRPSFLLVNFIYFLPSFLQELSSSGISCQLKLFSMRGHSTEVSNRDVSTGPLACLFAHHVHSFACSALLASLARSTTHTHLLACALRSAHPSLPSLKIACDFRFSMIFPISTTLRGD